jgi:hypothetical protein
MTPIFLTLEQMHEVRRRAARERAMALSDMVGGFFRRMTSLLRHGPAGAPHAAH